MVYLSGLLASTQSTKHSTSASLKYHEFFILMYSISPLFVRSIDHIRKSAREVLAQCSGHIIPKFQNRVTMMTRSHVFICSIVKYSAVETIK
ncbi:hypothetical protein RclHR1_08600011 [Rhizophagus clarus]|uniref:Uncharacterized protein n=1 Tax=Rhizophagus clarus TaxID=94130 RepID=A0A2Z6S7V5_9GLOM|nr:hypothetical protein RclHR1_08600011 [Rhizophagus clarus]GES97939.1 hypothetical protein RCL_e26903_RclHR1_08600011 [Rhizophagus clarus]